jgi:hypothetical protein
LVGALVGGALVEGALVGEIMGPVHRPQVFGQRLAYHPLGAPAATSLESSFCRQGFDKGGFNMERETRYTTG